MQRFGFTTIDRILAMSFRQLKDADINEDHAIEMIGEALDFLEAPGVQEEAMLILDVVNHEALLPDRLLSIYQLALLDKDYVPNIAKDAVDMSSYPSKDKTEIRDSCEDTCYKPYFDMQMQYINWIQSDFFHKNCTPIRLANSTFFNSIVCNIPNSESLYKNCKEEYTIVGTLERKFRFSFERGKVILSYVRAAVDKETGYPLIPDNIRYTTAISYYIKWKIAEKYAWEGRAGFDRLSMQAEQSWNKYSGIAKNYSMMPQTIDDYQDLLENNISMIPNNTQYYSQFKNLGKAQKNYFTDPDNRNRY